MAGPGKLKTGGRKRGTPNKKTQELLGLLEEKNFNPAEKLISVYRRAIKSFDNSKGSSGQGPDMTFKYLEIAEKAASDLMQYVYPKRKAIDHTSGGQPINFADLMAKAADARRKP
jgi:hypothetical protein